LEKVRIGTAPADPKSDLRRDPLEHWREAA
jgi:hypothetical protein